MISMILELKSIKYFRWCAFAPNTSAKTWKYPSDIPQFSIWRENMFGYVRLFLPLDIVWSSTFTVFRERSCCSLFYIHKCSLDHRKQFIEILHRANITKRYIILLSSRHTGCAVSGCCTVKFDVKTSPGVWILSMFI